MSKPNESTLPDLNTSVADFLEQWPQAIPVFLRHHMACVGCSMSAFETLGGAAKIYNVPADDFLSELAQSISG